MKTMLLKSLAEKLKLVDIQSPNYANDEVLIKVLTVGLNFADTLLISGRYQEKPELPFSPGMEVCGIVHAVGHDVKNFVTGERVVSFIGVGGLAEFVAASKYHCFAVPSNITDEEAASLLVAYGSTELALNYRAHLQPEETLLVLGASGGVGLSAIEIGKIIGSTVIAIARGSDKCLKAKEAGADIVLDSQKINIKTELKLLGGVDVIYDPVGGDQFQSALSAARPEARVLPIGFASGSIPLIRANIIMVKNINIVGFYIGGYKKFKPEVLADCFNRLLELCSKKTISPHISNIFPLSEANEALDLIRNRSTTGKVVIRVSNK